MSRILVVEDEEHLAEGLAFNLRNAGYDVDVAETGEQALSALADGPYDLVLLDVMLPGIDGLEVARRVRQAGNTKPILMVTAKDRSGDAIEGLEAGADDYITKPFDLEEVLARIRGALRRQVWDRASSTQPADGMHYGAWNVDFKRYIATHPDGRTIELTARETDILRFFASRPDEVISRESFLRDVWDIKGAVETRAVDNFMRKLRLALEEDPAHPRHIVSVRGAGYRFVP